MHLEVEEKLRAIGGPDLAGVEEAALSLAGADALPLLDLLTVAERLAEAGKSAAVKKLLATWIDHTSSRSAYVVHFNYAKMLAADGEFTGAEAMCRRALALNPDFLQARLNLGTYLERQGRSDETLVQWRSVLAHKNIGKPENKPLHLHALNNIGRLLESRRDFREALSMMEKSLDIVPDQVKVQMHRGHLRQNLCLWPLNLIRKGKDKAQIARGCSPLAMLAATDDPELQLEAAKWFMGHRYPGETSRLAPPGGYGHQKLRIGYLSSDFCMHAVSLLMVELFELHDRDRFEIYGFCWSREDGTPLRERVIEAMDRFVRIAGMSDQEAADCIRGHEIDILIDLHGITDGTRPLILSFRPAPVQLTYLGFPGTTGSPWIDYVIADKYLIPEESARFYTEKPLYLPGCFQVSNSKRPVGPTPTRAENQLPEDAFVFCSFNNNYKYTPELFAVWMRILKRVPGSVLWLLADNDLALKNLCLAAKKQGIKKDRLIFAPRVPSMEYMARYQLVDLFLDTFPFNGGTTANDALYMGVPLLTLSGRTFASRMAGSLLTHLGLPELIATDFQGYEEKAVRFAKKPAELGALQSRLQESRAAGPVFDTPRFVKSSEESIVVALESKTSPVAGQPAPGSIVAAAVIQSAPAVEPAGSPQTCPRSLLVQGWTGINHSYAMVNQYQLLAMSKDPSLELFQQEMPYFNSNWSKEKNGAGFSEAERRTLAEIKTYAGEPVSAIYRIHTPCSLDHVGVKVLSFLITELGLDRNNFLSPPDIRSYEAAGNLVVTSSFWSRERLIDFGFTPEAVVVVPCGVATDKFFPLGDELRRASRVALGYNDGDVVFLNVGAPIWNKGLDLVLKAYFKVRETQDNVCLLIKDQQQLYGHSVQQMIGNLVARGEIKPDARAIESVRVIPTTVTIEQLRSLYGVADYYLSPYRAEGFNLPVIEAITCGTRAIVTAGGSTDDFCDERTSIKIPSTKYEHAVINTTPVSAYLEPDLPALVEILQKCAQGGGHDPAGFSAGREKLLENFTWEQAARMLLALI